MAANTGSGVFKNDGPYTAYISLNKVADLQGALAITPQLILGANTTITAAIAILRQGCGSGSVSAWIRINLIAGSGSGSESGYRRAKMTQKNRKKYRIFMF